MNKRLLLTGLASLCLSACVTTQAGLTSGDALTLPSISIPPEWSQSGARTTPDREFHMGWLDRFGDEALTTLVKQAYDNNPNLQRLQARLDQARAQSEKARSALFPSLGFNASGTRAEGIKGSQNTLSDLNMSLNVTWEPDLWGRLDASYLTGQRRAQAAREGHAAARHVLAASVIENYFLTVEARRLAQVAKTNLEALNKTLGFVTVQYERGLRSGQDIALIKTDAASARVSYNRAEGAARDALRALNILMGMYPQTAQSISIELPDVPDFNALGQPANILSHRPDVRAAQYRVYAAYAGRAAAKAAAKPNLTLGGTIGGNASSLETLFDPASIAASLFSNIAAPIFDGGIRKSDIAIAKAATDESLGAYKETALAAFRDVERQIDQGQILMQQEAELTQALSDARDALRFTQFRYESGESDLLNVLSVQQRVSFIEGQLVSTRRARLVQYVNVSLALGIKPNV